MNLNKSAITKQLFSSPLRTTIAATIASLILAIAIHLLFISGGKLSITILLTILVAPPIAYASSYTGFKLKEAVEAEKTKRVLEHERAKILAKFMRDAAHEFKTPLTVMETSLYLLEHTADATKKAGHAEQVSHQIHALNTLLDTILVLTRLDSTDKEDYTLEHVHAADLLAAFPFVTTRGRVKLVVENAANLPDVRANNSDIILALKQIVDNALRYSPPEMDVTVRVGVVEKNLVIAIEDHGVGIPPEICPQIFDRFFRLDVHHTTRGLGLGLAIAKSVFELHDGRIEVESEVGKGTTMKTYLPISHGSKKHAA